MDSFNNQNGINDLSLFTWIWVVLLSSVGGAVNFFRKIKSKHSRAFNVVEFIGELTTSAFTGVITYLLCMHAEFGSLLTAALVGISGHMGSRLLFQFEIFIQKIFPNTDN